MSRDIGNPTRARRWLARAAATLAAWLVAFGAVIALLTLFGGELGSLPLALRALVLSGVLVALMANLVMPVLSVAVARWLPAGPPPRKRRAEPGIDGQEPRPGIVAPGAKARPPHAAAAPGAGLPGSERCTGP